MKLGCRGLTPAPCGGGDALPRGRRGTGAEPPRWCEPDAPRPGLYALPREAAGLRGEGGFQGWGWRCRRRGSSETSPPRGFGGSGETSLGVRGTVGRPPRGLGVFGGQWGPPGTRACPPRRVALTAAPTTAPAPVVLPETPASPRRGRLRASRSRRGPRGHGEVTGTQLGPAAGRAGTRVPSV